MHVSSYMFKNALLNSDEYTKEKFLHDLSNMIKKVIKKESLSIKLNTCRFNLDGSALSQFLIPTSSKSYQNAFEIMLQALRLAGLLHDLGHLPFSHQCENALDKVYENIFLEKSLNLKQKEFKDLFEKLSLKNNKPFHEAVGDTLIEILFDIELNDLIEDSSIKEYLHLIKTLVFYIFTEEKFKNFDFAVIHNFISGTIDADRLDYINRDMLSSGYIGGAYDNLRITKQTVLVRDKNFYKISFFDMSLMDIEHILEMRFNLYKKIIFNHSIAKTDCALENVIIYLCEKYFRSNMFYESNSSESISMLWSFLNEKDLDKRLDLISMLDENWLISLFKKEYFEIKVKKRINFEDKRFLKLLEEVLFGKNIFISFWKNLNEFYNILDFSKIQRYKYRESFGFVDEKKSKTLKELLDEFCKKYQDDDRYFIYQIVSINIGIDKDFMLFDGENSIKIDEVSTIRKRLKKSILNTVPFYIYSNKTVLTKNMIEDLSKILVKSF